MLKKNVRVVGAINKVTKTATKAKLTEKVLFEASSLRGRVSARLMSDQAVDTSLMPTSQLEENLAKVTRTNVEITKPPHINMGIVGDVSMHCLKKITSNMYLKILHSSSFHCRNINCKFPDEPIPCLILGRAVLKSIGGSNRKTLEAPCEWARRTIDFEKKLSLDGNTDDSEGSIASSLRSMFHN